MTVKLYRGNGVAVTVFGRRHTVQVNVGGRTMLDRTWLAVRSWPSQAALERRVGL